MPEIKNKAELFLEQQAIEKAGEYVDVLKAVPKANLGGIQEKLNEIIAWSNTLSPEVFTPRVRLRVNFCIAYNARLQGRYEDIYRSIKEVESCTPILEDYLYYAMNLNEVSRTAYMIGLGNIAIEYAFKAISYLEKIDSPIDLIQAYIRLGVSYGEIKGFEEELKYYEKAYAVAERINHYGFIMVVLNNIAFAYYELGNYEKSKEVINQYLSKKLPTDRNQTNCDLYINKALIDIEENNYEAALEDLKIASDYDAKFQDFSFQINMHKLGYKVNKKLGNTEAAAACLEAGMALSAKRFSPKYQLICEELKIEDLKEKNDFENAFKHQEIYIKLKQQMDDDILKAQFQYLKVEQEVKELLNEFDHVKQEKDTLSKELDTTKDILENTQKATIYTLATLAEYRDQITGKHLLRMIDYITLFCQFLSPMSEYHELLSEKYIQDFAQSASLHDIGKIAIPDDILKKPGRLTPDEFEIIKRHPMIGRDALAVTENILGEQSFLKLAQIIAFSHHEKWDGSGYPLGLKETGIPFEGRIMAIIDVYDALISMRPYKKGMTHLEALDILRSGCGKQFDPDLVSIFLNHHLDFMKVAIRLADSDLSIQYLASGIDPDQWCNIEPEDTQTSGLVLEDAQ